MNEWRDIKTAPQDGTPVIAGRMSARMVWHPVTSRFLNGAWCAEFRKDEWVRYTPQPTHWMPTGEEHDG